MSDEGSMTIDMGRVVQHATQAMAGSAADLAAQLGMAREVAEVRAAKVAELEQALAAKTAELARVAQINEQLTSRVQDLTDQQHADGNAVTAPADPEVPHPPVD